MNKIVKIFESRISIAILIVVMRLLLDYVYIEVVSPVYYYLGLTVSVTILGEVLSWIVLVLIIILMNSIVSVDTQNNKGAIVLAILLCCSGIPTTTIIACFEVSPSFSILLSIYWILTVFLYKRKSKFKFKITECRIIGSEILLYVIFFVLAFSVILVVVRYTGFSVTFDLAEVYTLRTNFKSDNIPSLLQYPFFTSTMIMPVILVYALSKKKYVMVVFAVIIQLLAFFADGRKSTLFMLVLTVVGYFLIHNFNVRLIPIGAFAVVSLGCLEKWIFSTSFFINYVVRRLFLLPAYLQYAYYDFFAEHEKDFLRQSILGRLGFDSPYSDSIPRLIGKGYYGGSYANNGLFSDAFANFGVFGVILYPILLVLALKMLDKCSKNLSVNICIGVIFTAAYAFLSTFYFTVMLTHGFIISCIVVYFMPGFQEGEMRPK